MIRRFRNRKFESSEQQNEITAYDVANFLRRKGLVISTAPYPKDAGVLDGDCFVALKDNGEFLVFHDLAYDDGEVGVIIMTATWYDAGAKREDIFTKEDIENKISKLL